MNNTLKRSGVGTLLALSCVNFVLLAPGAVSAQTNVSFGAHRDYVAADVPKGFAQADMNGDAIPDLVVPNSSPNFTLVSVLLGNSDGSFQAPRFFDTGAFGPAAAVIADFNSDGKKDVAVATLAGVSLLLGDGAGNLGAPRMFIVGSIPQALAAGDFNGDGKVDLAVANFTSNNVSILLGNGQGSFSPATNLSVGRAPLGIAVGDFDHDGRQDLAVANSNQGGGNPGPGGNTVSILIGLGDGGFKPAVNIPVARGPIGVAVSDLNQDTKQDVVVTNSLTDQVSVLLGNGDGTFLTPSVFTVASGGNPVQGFFPSYVAIDDFNADGKLDLAVANPNTSTVALLSGDGQGNFGRPLNMPMGRSPVAVLTGDFNHDGRVDFISSNKDGNTVSVVFGRGNGKFVDASSFRANASPAQIVSADFNGDAIPDLATVNAGNSQDGHTVSVLLGIPGAGFANQRVLNVENNPLSLATGDFNNDGNVDVVAANFGKYPDDPGSFSLLMGRGNGTFRPAVTFPAGDFPESIAVADFNADGKADVAVANFGTNIGVSSISIVLGDGNGGFAPPVNIVPPVENVLQILTGDFNGDGKADVAFSSRDVNDALSLLLGNGDGTFGSPKTVVTSFLVFAYIAGDFNHDGIQDFAVEEGGVIEMLLGTSQGNYQSAGQFSEGEAASFSVIQSLAVGDFNGDGFLDIAAPDGFSDNLSILLGNGDGTLGLGQLFAGGPAGGVVVADFNHDRRPDIAIAATDSRNNQGKVILLLNHTQTGLAQPN